MMNIPYPALHTDGKKRLKVGLLALLAVGSVSAGDNIPQLEWMSHDRDRPLPEVVTPGEVSYPGQVGTAPSDATVLFDGTSLDAWVDMAGHPTKWIINDGALECVPQGGYVRTKQSFGDCQLHVEWATPTDSTDRSQGRGNSGVFFGLDRYEIQVLDSYQNKTYSDGSASALYGQYPPLVNASKAPGEWQTYDIIYTAPRFNDGGELTTPARITVIHNGVLTQNHSVLTGPTGWIGRAPYQAHQEKLPIAFQDHGNPVRYRNVWVRELGPKDKPEYYLSAECLDAYVGAYERGDILRGDNGLLILKMAGASLELYAQSETLFFAKTTDVLVDFSDLKRNGEVKISVGDDASWMTTKLK